MKLSHSIRKRFTKDYNLPVQVVQDPYFDYYLNTLNPHFDTISKLKLLTEAVETLGGEGEFFNEAERIRGKIVNAIQETKEYSQLSQPTKFELLNHIVQKNVYTLENVDKTFISIDLKQANFTAFKFYSSNLVLNQATYEDLIGSVTDLDYFKKSKYIRQVIFGNLMPKKQQQIQQYLMDHVVSVLNQNAGIDIKSFISASADEVVFSVEMEKVEETISPIKEKLSNGENGYTLAIFDALKINAFKLNSIGNKSFFVKESLLDNTVDFKGIPSFLFMQAYKRYTNQPLEDKDLIFFHEGYLSTFKQFVFD